MVLTVHRWFSNKSCPGDWLFDKLGDLAKKVTDALDEEKSVLYRVRKSWVDATSQIGAYRVLDNAKKAADNNYGYMVFDENGNVSQVTATFGDGRTSVYDVSFETNDTSQNVYITGETPYGTQNITYSLGQEKNKKIVSFI